jgi:hypothetical protein
LFKQKEKEMATNFKNQALNRLIANTDKVNLQISPYKGIVGGYSIEMVISYCDNVYDSYIYDKETDRDSDLDKLIELLSDEESNIVTDNLIVN